MQTFLPYPDYTASAKCLDMRRLGKQRVEVLQLLRALTGQSKGWANHPAALMWKGYERNLCEYGMTMCQEWTDRGYKDTCHDKLALIFNTLPTEQFRPPFRNPPWLGDDAFHAAHRSNLLRKDPDWYGQFGWTEPNDLPYIWPKGE